MTPDPPSSPCVGVCEMRGGLCRGCRRTIEEIVLWRQLSEAERLRIMRDELPRRADPDNPQQRGC